MMRLVLLCALLAAPKLTVANAARRTVPAGYTETILATGLQRPVALAWLPASRLLIAEQYTGNILMYKNGAVQATPYATLSPVSSNTNETGLLGMCVDPNFATNGYVYVFATQTPTVQRIWRYTTVGDVGTSATIIVDNIPTNNGYHNAGGIGFGPDGKFYVLVGDNGPSDLGVQQLTTWRGKTLRFNSDGTIPTDNPFSPTSAIYTRGHRNPFRFTFRPNGSMICTENGPNVDDEINKIVAGHNYGWPNYTGPNNPNGAWGPLSPTPDLPIYTYGVTIAITDVCFYTGTTMPLTGEMLICDYKNGRIQRFTLDANDQVTAGPTDFVTAVNQVVDLEEGPDGALYYCSLLGGLYRVQASGAGNMAPVASFTASPTSGAPPLPVNVDGAVSYDPDGSVASYSWNWGDGSPTSTGVSASHTFAAAGAYIVTLTVTDNLGATSTATSGIIVSSGNLPPSAHIESITPPSGPAPLACQFDGHGHDDAGGLSHTWNFGDGSPTVTLSGYAEGANSMTTHTYIVDGTYTVTLTITDAGGLTASIAQPVAVATPGGGGGGSGGKKKKCGLLGVELIPLLLILRRRR